MFCSVNNNLLKIGNNKYISHLFCNYCYKDMLDIYFARKNLNLSIKQQTCQNRKSRAIRPQRRHRLKLIFKEYFMSCDLFLIIS